jgi:hypothetical protein
MTSPLQQKVKVNGPVVVTANRVGDGAVVYRRADGAWTTDLAEARVATDATTAGALIAAAVADDLRAVGPYIAPVQVARDGALEPGNLREIIRRLGPSIALPQSAGN